MNQRHSAKIRQLASVGRIDDLIGYIGENFHQNDEYVKELHNQMAKLTNIVAENAGISYNELRENDHCHQRRYSLIRHKVMYIAHKLTRRNSPAPSLGEIGAFFSKKDHATVLHGIKTIDNLMSYDRALVKEIDNYTLMFKNVFE